MREKTISFLGRKKIGVLYGGWSGERAISLKSGAAVLASLRRLGIPCVGIDVTPRLPEQIRRSRIGAAFVILHGPFGEDGTVQGLLEMMRIPYTGSGVLACAQTMHKPSAKRIFESAGIPTPRWRLVVRDRFRETSMPFKEVVVKPASQGSALGVTVVTRKRDFQAALRRSFRYEREALVEEYVRGTEITVAILGRRVLPVIEIVPQHAFYDFHSKYAAGGSRHLIPPRLPAGVIRRAEVLALRAFDALGCRDLGRVDLIVPASGRPTVLEVNVLPGMTQTSLFPDAARAAGLGFDDLILEILRGLRRS
ncbi:MAG TPA: D-alanine--D-alanine ligase [Elusimicrobiota bacterium]|nr:D-alanine--D-alanine ligase [Elusimicrobiota bacterium]